LRQRPKETAEHEPGDRSKSLATSPRRGGGAMSAAARPTRLRSDARWPRTLSSRRARASGALQSGECQTMTSADDRSTAMPDGHNGSRYW
jgi:hypothetical protein